MDSAEIVLVSKTYESDNIGNQIAQRNVRKVFAQIGSITQKEFSVAGQMGLKTELKAVVWKFEYAGEEAVILNDTEYAIYRTYIIGDKIELYLTKEL